MRSQVPKIKIEMVGDDGKKKSEKVNVIDDHPLISLKDL